MLIEFFLCASSFKSFFQINLAKSHNNPQIIAFTDKKTEALRTELLYPRSPNHAVVGLELQIMEIWLQSLFLVSRIQLDIISLFINIMWS